MADPCIFCRIADLEVPVELLYEDHLLVAFRDINPAAPVHILLVPKKHIPDVRALTDIEAGLLGKIIEVANMLADREGIADTGFRLVINTGLQAGQSVNHLHVHLLGGRAMTWPPG